MREPHAINLCPTIEARPIYIKLPCVPRLKSHSVFFPLNRDLEYDRRHEWGDGNGGRDGGRCAHCQRTLKDVRIRVNPKTNRPISRRGLAFGIASMRADVPPIEFVGTV